MLIVASFFSFFMAVVCSLVIRKKWALKFKNPNEEEIWHKKHDKSLKIIMVILIIVGIIQLFRGGIEIYQYFNQYKQQLP